MNILTKIINRKKEEVAYRKQNISLGQLQTQPLYVRQSLSLKSKLLTDTWGIIAEFKRKSPSKGILNQNISPQVVAKGYQMAGASGVSCLTDIDFFGGSDEDFAQARSVLEIPLLRKDFTVDTYQLYESKALGADIILLIAAALESSHLKELAHQAKEIGLEVLLEVHNAQELEETLNSYVDIVGVNNRNLKTFDVDIQTSIELSKLIPDDYAKISESGITSPQTIHTLKSKGFHGFLIGENFMKENSPELALQAFMQALKSEHD